MQLIIQENSTQFKNMSTVFKKRKNTQDNSGVLPRSLRLSFIINTAASSRTKTSFLAKSSQ